MIITVYKLLDLILRNTLIYFFIKKSLNLVKAAQRLSHQKLRHSYSVLVLSKINAKKMSLYLNVVFLDIGFNIHYASILVMYVSDTAANLYSVLAYLELNLGHILEKD